MDQDMDVVTEARQLGWAPLEEFRGDPAKWVDAETFVQKGRTVMPILQENNRRLEKTVQEQAAELKRLREVTQTSQDAILALQEVYEEDTKRKVQAARDELRANLKQAKLDGDIDLEVSLTEELTSLNQAEKVAKAAPPPPPPPTTPQVDPDLAKWMEKNPWFGQDTRRTQKAMGIAQILRSEDANDALTGQAFYAKLDAELAGTPAPSKVEGSDLGGTGGRSGGGKSFGDLPADAKDACDKQGKRVIGEGKAFKTQSDWRKHYTDMYFKEY